MKVRTVLLKYMKEHGYTGLRGEECSCRINVNDQGCCGQDLLDCEFGFWRFCDDCKKTNCENKYNEDKSGEWGCTTLNKPKESAK